MPEKKGEEEERHDGNFSGVTCETHEAVSVILK